MGDLFPEIKPYATHQLRVDDIHTLYIEECGSPDGIPVVFLHGGPGAGCLPYHRRFFDPNRYRIVLFDQRGCGRSTPHAELRDNTTAHLIRDMEQIRDMLAIDDWVVFGGSWGSTLALAYAETHPEQVKAMILRGVFLCRKREIEWFYQQGASRIFPDYWEDYLAVIPEAEQGDLLQAYYRRLTGADELARMAAAKAWSLWEARTANLLPGKDIINHFSDPYVALSLARIESHYFMHDAFLEPNQLLDKANKISHLPGIIVHGRYDMICPVESAWELHRAWPNSKLTIVDYAAHSADEPDICRALVNATNFFAGELQ